MSDSNLAKALIGYRISDFKQNKGKDLLINFHLGLSGYGVIAEYKNGNITFTDKYYQYMKESGNKY